MKLLRPSLLLFSSILLIPPAAFAGQNRGAISRGSVSHAAVSRPSVSRPAGNFRAVSRNSFGTLGGQRWATNNFSRTSNFSRSNLARTNFSRTNFSGTNLRSYNNFNRGTLASNNSTLRNNSVLRSNNLGVNRNFNRVGNGRFANNDRLHRNGNGSGNWNGNWNHNHHHHHHGGSSIIFIGGFGYPWYYGSSYYDYYPTFYPYGDYGYGGYGSYPTSSYAYSGGSYDGGVYEGGDPGVY